MEKKELFKRVFLAPLDFITLFPLVVGATLGLGVWAFDARSGLLWFLSVCLMLISPLIYVQRLTLGWIRNVERVQQEWQMKQDQLREQRLDDLKIRLKKDRDKRTDELFDDLRTVIDRLTKESGAASGWMRSVSLETMDVLGPLFNACVHYLEKSLELFVTAESVNDKSIKKRTMDEREKLIGEVQKSLHQLGEILADVRAINLKRATSPQAGGGESDGMEQFRKELAAKLEAAREVERAVSTGVLFPGVDIKKYMDKAKEGQKKEGG